MSQRTKKRGKLFGKGAGIVVALAAGLTVAFAVSGSASGSPAATTTTANQAPKVVKQPSVSGTAQQGQTLTANNGTWSGAQPMSFGYQWQRCDSSGCHEIYAANKQTYTLTAADVGDAMRVKVTASNQYGSTLAITSKTSSVSAPKATTPQATTQPSVSGTPQEGQKLTGNRGSWSGNPTDFNYFWVRCDKSGGSCSDISGAHAATYTLTSADVGNTIRFKVQASNSAGSTFASSVPTAVIKAKASPAPAPAPAPAPTGCPSGNGAISIGNLSAPARLLLDGQQASPGVIRSSSTDLTLRYHVTACGGRPVQGAMVYVTAVPFNQLSIPAEQATGQDGWAELRLHTLRGFPVSGHQELLALFARARKPGENLLGGVSTRRLFSLRVNLND